MLPAQRSVEFLPGDLAPGEVKSRELPTGEFTVHCVRSGADPLFARAFERLWAEFGARHEMEQPEVIARRLTWHPAQATGDCWLRYEMLVVRRRDEVVAVRDHTAVVACPDGAAHAVVHLSHVWVEPAWRRTGLAGWLRAWPLQTARACLAAAGQPMDSPVTLVAEMEHPEEGLPERMIRLKAYEKAGFKKIDPNVVPYLQPDFRPPAEIDAGGGPKPLPFGLIIRRVGREAQDCIRGAEIRHLVTALYRMYGAGFRERDMAGLWESLRDYPALDAAVALVAPTR
ncbi:MAG TPA: GNAT family N-acetyltransferase [Methylomirabilota bacterium]|nr:GNAT family N-acetyltransferase [Methylomirabilota bacterium]